MKIFISSLDLALLIGTIGALVIGLIIFFSVGTFHVKKGHAIIIESLGQFKEIHKEGWAFYMPFKYTRVGYYCIAPQERKIVLANGKELYITYEITDVKKYHYSNVRVEYLIPKIGRENENITKELLVDELNKIGVRYINIRAK